MCRLGSFRDVPAAASSEQLHADLRAGSWAATVEPGALQAELAARQGLQALVPGPLGDSAAAFYVPALACSPAMLHAGTAAVRECTQRRVWSGCHQ